MARAPPPKPRRNQDAFGEPKLRTAKLPGQHLAAQDIDGQVAGLQVRAAVLNGFTALGIHVTDVVGRVCPGKQGVRPEAGLRNRTRVSEFSGPRQSKKGLRDTQPFVII